MTRLNGLLSDAVHETITAGALPETIWQCARTACVYEAWRMAVPDREWRLLARLVAGRSAMRSSPS